MDGLIGLSLALPLQPATCFGWHKSLWSVYAPTSLRHRALVGNYVGASADAAIGVGGGANVLVGGNSA
ncbi:MAG: DUF992 domain-containing protein, partial [Rhodomicrobium sp.]